MYPEKIKCKREHSIDHKIISSETILIKYFSSVSFSNFKFIYFCETEVVNRRRA